MKITLGEGDKKDEPQAPKEITKFYPSELEARKIKKPLICYLLDVDKKNKKSATLIQKPIKLKYGKKWFKDSSDQVYFVNYSQIMNFGKHYAYLCQFGNSVGALAFHEYPETVDGNQMLMMVQQHAVEVFKKHKGISPKLVLIIAIIALVAIVGMIIAIDFAFGFSNQLNAVTSDNRDDINQIHQLQCKYENLNCPPPTSATKVLQ